MAQVEKFSAVTIRIEANWDRSRVLWNLRCDDGTQAQGFCKTKHEALAKAVAYVQAMAAPAAIYSGPKLVASNPKKGGTEL